ncbi:hypothetical protein PYCC9005_003836 [Savitreella phatthalungensis]
MSSATGNTTGRASRKAGMLTSAKPRHRGSGTGTPPSAAASGKRVASYDNPRDSPDGSAPSTPTVNEDTVSETPDEQAEREIPGESASAEQSNLTLPTSKTNEPMQLSYVKSSSASTSDDTATLPNYPIADTIALLLILVNFPSLLVTVSHLLFSYKEHALTSSNGIPHHANLPLAMIIFIDAAVLLFTAVLMPWLQHVITDVSHIIIAISMSGGSSRMTFPFALGLAGARTAVTRLWSFSFQDQKVVAAAASSAESSSLPINFPPAWTDSASSLLRPFKALRWGGMAGNPVVDHVKSVVAIHVFTIGMLRLISVWLRDSQAQSAAKVETSESKSNSNPSSALATSSPSGANLALLKGNIKKRNITAHPTGPFAALSHTHDDKCDDLVGPSIWDTLMHWRIEMTDKRADLCSADTGNQTAPHFTVWISEIASMYIVLGIRIPRSFVDDLDLRVNGLPWKSRPSITNEDDDDGEEESDTIAEERKQHEHDEVLCSLFVDNLSPKTEYELTLRIVAQHSVGEHQFTVCTQPQQQPQIQTRRTRGDSNALPPLGVHPSAQSSSANVTTSSGCPTSPAAVTTTTNPGTPTAVATAGENEAQSNAGPPSPISTLEDSIAIAAAKLEEKRQTLKRARKDNTKRLQQLQRECDHLSSRVNAFDKNEHRLQGRILSLQNELKRMEVQVEEMESERERYKAKRLAQVTQWEKQRAKRDAEARTLDKVRERYDREKKSHEREFAAAEQDAAKSRAKADRLSLRRTKIQQELDRLDALQDQILRQEYADRQIDRERTMAERLQIEADLLKSIHEISHSIDLASTYGVHTPPPPSLTGTSGFSNGNNSDNILSASTTT